MDFYDLDLEDCVFDALDAMKFKQCTPVQEQSIPIILEGHDLIAVAQTGTGKTAAYLLPVISELCRYSYPEHAINCVIMSPTRELAQQIDQQLEGFSYYNDLTSIAIYGGNDGDRYNNEVKSLQLGADIIVATPGRLLSHIKLGNVDLSQVSFFILDEADRMLDMGFYDDIMSIIKLTPKDRQTIMFSATMPPKIHELAKNILHNPKEVKIANSKPAEKIKQTAYICYEPQKIKILKSIIKKDDPKRVIIFSSSKQKVKEVTRTLKQMHVNTAEMHSDLEQAERDVIMRDFKNNHIDILVATDIVSRGIDIDDITLVINYDVPRDSEDYVHRIGRTARANRDGAAITLVSEDDQIRFRLIEKMIEKEVEKTPVPAEFGETPEYKPLPEKKGRGRRKNYGKPNNRNGKGNGNKPKPNGGQGGGKPHPKGRNGKPQGNKPRTHSEGNKSNGAANKQ